MSELQIGDRVEILRKDIFHLNGVEGWDRWGTVTDIDGFYITVRPKRKRWEIELYDNEVKLIPKNKYDCLTKSTVPCDDCNCWKQSRLMCS